MEQALHRAAQRLAKACDARHLHQLFLLCCWCFANDATELCVAYNSDKGGGLTLIVVVMVVDLKWTGGMFDRDSGGKATVG
jgi:hypothetical protein